MKAGEARVLLTGATGGIGQASAGALLQAGASVMLTGRSPAHLSNQARALAQRFKPATRVHWHAADLTRAGAVAELCEAAAQWNCNVLVHNAGMASFGRLKDVTASEMLQVLHTNLLAPMLLTQGLLPHLRSLPSAQVICMGSVLGRIGLPGYSVYCATKFGLRGFAEALRRELGDTKVLVQYLGPRSTRTGFNTEAVEAYNRATATAMDPPTVAARALVRLMESKSAERFLGFPEKLAVGLNGMAPALLDGAFARHRRSLQPPCAAPSLPFEGDCDAAGPPGSHSVDRIR